MYIITNRDKIVGTRYISCKNNIVYFVEDFRGATIFETVDDAEKVVKLVHYHLDIPHYQTAAPMNIEEIKFEIVKENL